MAGLYSFTTAAICAKLYIYKEGSMSTGTREHAMMAATIVKNFAQNPALGDKHFSVDLETLVDLLRSLPLDAQKDLLHLMITIAKTMKTWRQA